MSNTNKITGFMEIPRLEQAYTPAADRIRHYNEFTIPLEERDIEKQAARCMDCGIPYCHTGCPVNNQIPDWNDLIYRKNWKEAAINLHQTNNFPEMTGRICPAPCEEACTLNLENNPVTIKNIECAIADKAFEEGWIKPILPKQKTGKKIAIIGSGPAGLAAAQQLARMGHETHIFERAHKAGGLLRYGIPDFKMEKHHIDKRVQQMQQEGVIFNYNVDVGHHIDLKKLQHKFHAILLACGAEKPRPLNIPGIRLNGCHLAMPYLTQQNIRNEGGNINEDEAISAQGKHVIVIGGGDTASDCIGTAFRQNAVSVTQMDIRQMPPKHENKMIIWPYWPTKLRTSSSQQEGAEREFAAATLEIIGENQNVIAVKCAKVDEKRHLIPNTEFELPADLVLIAIGFSGPKETPLLNKNIQRNPDGTINANTKTYHTSINGIFSAGDMRKGQSLVVWAIREGREAADAINQYVMKNNP